MTSAFTPTPTTKRPIARYPHNQRHALVRPLRRARVTYRLGSYHPFDRQVVGQVLGASHSLTNGTSSGDLIVYTTGRLVSISLANTGYIFPLEDQ